MRASFFAVMVLLGSAVDADAMDFRLSGTVILADRPIVDGDATIFNSLVGNALRSHLEHCGG